MVHRPGDYKVGFWESSALRERLDDIPQMAKHFIELSARDLKCAKPRLTRAVLAKLQNYDWPGNVREVRNVIERAVILARGGALDVDLPITAAPEAAGQRASGAASSTGDSAQSKYLTEPEIERLERDNLVRVLEAANWRVKGPDGAAELLGVRPTTLLSRMEMWGLKRPDPTPKTGSCPH